MFMLVQTTLDRAGDRKIALKSQTQRGIPANMKVILNAYKAEFQQLLFNRHSQQ